MENFEQKREESEQSPEDKKGTAKIVCAWCKKEMGTKEGSGTTHGICSECNEKILREILKTAEREMNPEIVERVEALDLVFAPDDKATFLLTCSKLKPASDILLFRNLASANEPWHPDSTNLEKARKEISELWSIIEESGVQVNWNRDSFLEIANNDEFKQLDIGVGRNKVGLDVLMLANKTGDHEARGLAYGFPKTAVEAFIGKRKKMHFEEIPEDIRNSEALAFCFFVPSVDNWREEIKQGQRNADFIKKISPEIYREVMERWNQEQKK